MNRKKLNLKWVTQTIGEDYKTWRKGSVVTIQAQTGTGKTFFVTGNSKIHGIIDRMECYENMVYICNRTELKRQIKLDLLKKFNQEIPCLKDEETKEFKLDKNKEKILDNDTLDKMIKIKNIVVTSYHAISNGKLENIYSNGNNNLDYFDYIVCDECHFFMSDAGYNQKSYLALEELVNTRHRNAIKIFISATMDEVKKIIDKQVEEQQLNILGNSFSQHDYTTGIDYSYLNINYFSAIKDIVQLIKNDKTNEKWVIFVTSKTKGEKINKDLEELKITSTFIYAGMSNEEKKRITAECKFNSKVLISTKCLDNGINIKDKSVKNMVIMTYDKTTFIQELGRVRFNITDAPTINLFIPLYSKKVFQGKIDDNYQPKINDVKLLKKDINKFREKYNNDIDKAPTNIFYLDEDNQWKINTLGYSRIVRDALFAEKMVIGFQNYDKFTFIKEQLSWLNLKDTFEEFNLIKGVADNKEIERLEDHLKNIEGKKLFSDDQQELSDLIIKELITISKDVDYRTEKLKPSTIETILRVQLKLEYAVSKSQKESKGEMRGKRYITIKKI